MARTLTDEQLLAIHIKNKQEVLTDMGMSNDDICSIPWARFENETQVDNYCKPLIYNYLSQHDYGFVQ